jgi:hypothetical protein
MSLPLHLQNIKSSGVYRFVYDKSVISGETAETLRLLVGYSDKGPFNTPVYIRTRDEFLRIYGGISKRLEKKGIFFHRLALEALAAGPILAMNLKPFTATNKVSYTGFSGSTMFTDLDPSTDLSQEEVTKLYDTNRFWTLRAEDLVNLGVNKYITVAATDSIDSSCSIIVRKAMPTEYGVSIRSWYEGQGLEMPDYLKPIQENDLNDYFLDVYVFRGKFTYDLCKADGPLGKYFNVTGTGDNAVITLEENFVDAFGEPADVLTALANDESSGYVAGYRGTTIPFFRNMNGTYISIDILFNSGYGEHKMLMNMDETKLDGLTEATDIDALMKPVNITVDTITYSHLMGQYAVLANPTDVEKAAAVQAANNEAPDTVNPVDASSKPIVYVVDSQDPSVKTYYKLSYLYVDIPAAEVTKTIKKKAVEVDVKPTTDITAASPEYIKFTTETGASIKPLYIPGFTYDSRNITTSDCLNVITGEYGKGLQEALTNRVDIEYHYLVDTFDTALYNDKTTLAALAKKKDNCFAILNFPKIKDYIKDGGYNTNKTLDFKKVTANFHLPDEVDGASWCGYFTQIVLTDGTIRTTVPSAGLVSNLFMDKWSSRQPYYIVAGSSYGRLLNGALVGPDYAFSKDDRDILEPFGINVIVYEPRRGTYINSEQTAKQIPVSALSKIHIRELVIYLQDEIADMLESYRWELNTQTLRDRVKAKADAILEQVRGNGGVYDYLNVCDSSNNTAEAIDNEFLVLDTHIEPARGAGKMVEQLYIYRTGEMRSQLIQG